MASGIFALCKRLHSTLVESGLRPLSDEIILYYDARSKKHQVACACYYSSLT